MHFYNLNLGPLERGYLGPYDFYLNKFVNESLGNATKFQAFKPVGSEEEDFFNVFIWFEPRTSWPRAILDPGESFEQS